MMHIFSDNALTQPIEDNILIEGQQYYVDFREIPPEERKAIVEDAKLGSFLNLHPQNPIGILRVDDYVGRIRCGVASFDVRSAKFLPGRNGVQQYQTLLDDVRNMHGSVAFRYGSPASADLIEDPKNQAPIILERFHYFRQLIFLLPRSENLEGLLNAVWRNPHEHLERASINRSLSQSRRPDIRRIASMGGRLRMQPATSSFSSSPLSHHSEGGLFLPEQVPERICLFNRDTPENRFLLFFLREIESVALRVVHLKEMNEKLHQEANDLLVAVRRFITHPFFSEVGEGLGLFPDASSVLTARSGYREIFHHYLRSRMGSLNLVERLDATSFTSPLKNMALLYEIWCFYQVATTLLRSPVQVDSKWFREDNGSVVQGFIWSDGIYRVAYNITYTPPTQSYSLRLRPDIVVERIGDPESRRFIFDAKYKLQKTGNSEDDENTQESVSGEVKAVDIHKMHTYVDAISKAQSAIVLYPGNKFVFFERGNGRREWPKDVGVPSGVGAVPLAPGCGTEMLDSFIDVIVKNVNNSGLATDTRLYVESII